jgi:hypothetical protein
MRRLDFILLLVTGCTVALAIVLWSMTNATSPQASYPLRGCAVFGSSLPPPCASYPDWTSGTWPLPSGVTQVHALLVGGGGGGGASVYLGTGGSGGASGSVVAADITVSGGLVQVQVGEGGAGGYSYFMGGRNGGDSIFADQLARGGGGGGAIITDGNIPQGGSLRGPGGVSGGGGAGGGSYQYGYISGAGGSGGTGGSDGASGLRGGDPANATSGALGGTGSPFPQLGRAALPSVPAAKAAAAEAGVEAAGWRSSKPIRRSSPQLAPTRQAPISPAVIIAACPARAERDSVQVAAVEAIFWSARLAGRAQMAWFMSSGRPRSGMNRNQPARLGHSPAFGD